MERQCRYSSTEEGKECTKQAELATGMYIGRGVCAQASAIMCELHTPPGALPVRAAAAAATAAVAAPAAAVDKAAAAFAAALATAAPRLP